jgi:prepilin-type processing-associated H-X9-DG protein
MPVRDRKTSLPSDETYRFGSIHPAGVNMMYCDGSVHHITYTIDPLVFRSGGNRFDNSAWPARP